MDRPTLIAYDSIMYGFSLFLDRAEQMKEQAAVIVDGRSAFYEQNYSLFDGRKTNASDIARRDDALVDSCGPLSEAT